MLVQQTIGRKRDGHALDAGEIASFIRGVCDGSVSEGQIAALAMAICWRGMNAAECVALTLAMRDSGEVLDWRSLDLPGPVVDKHSTGGVGDLVSLVLGPMVAACGGFVPMISGRGLGHTGGTLDKLDAIPRYQTSPDMAAFKRTVREAGVAIVGASAALAPADRRIYAIRDVTATVESVALITASILSKKLAAGLDALVLDVKVGSGAFMPDLEASTVLARSLVDIGCGAGLNTKALLTDMNEALAPCAGNAIEVRSAIDYLTGAERPAKLHRVTMALGAQMLLMGGLAKEAADAEGRLLAALASGRAAERFAQMVAALGGPADLLERPAHHLPSAPVVKPVPALRSGWLAQVDARALGMAVVGLGGGRRVPNDRIDAAVGISDLAPLGATLRPGDALGLVHARSEADAERAVAAMQAACRIKDDRPDVAPALIGTIER